MRQLFTKTLTALLALTLAIGLMAIPAASAAPEQDSIVIMLWGGQPTDWEAVQAEYENRTKDTLNTKINIIWTDLGEYGNKIKLKLSAGEQIDACFDAQWVEMLNFIAQGVYENLDPYFESGEYPGLNAAFGESVRDNNCFSGHVYGFPLAQTYGEVEGVLIRKDLREKYGLDPLESLEDLEHYFDLVLENETGVIPYAASTTNDIQQIFGHVWTPALAKQHIYQFALGFPANLYGLAILNEEETEVKQVTLVDGYAGSVLKMSPDVYDVAREWYQKGYVEREVISQQDPSGLFLTGRAAAIHGGPDFYSAQNQMSTATPGAVLEFFANNPDTRDMKPGSIVTDFKAWNFICIPVTSQKIDRTLGFFNWLWSDQANHDLIEFGIEGVHWTADGADRYSYIDGAPEYRFLGFTMSWNQNYVRYPAGIDDNSMQYLKYERLDSTFIPNALSGFNFDTESVKTEIAKTTPVIEEIYMPALVGMLPDPQASMLAAYAKAEELGLSTILNEAARQINAFLAEKN